MTHRRRDHVYTGKKKVRKSTKKRDIYFELFDINNGTDKIETSQDSFPKKIEKKKKISSNKWLAEIAQSVYL